MGGGRKDVEGEEWRSLILLHDCLYELYATGIRSPDFRWFQ